MTDPRPPRLRPGVLGYLGYRYFLLDDGGAQREMETSKLWFGWWGIGKDLREKLRRPRREITPSVASFIVYMLVCMVLIGLIETNANTSTWPKVQAQIANAIVIVGACTASSAFIAARFRRRSGEYVKLMKARALCPVCIYSLEGMETDSEHMVTCPECGAKWRFDPAPKATPFASGAASSA